MFFGKLLRSPLKTKLRKKQQIKRSEEINEMKETFFR